MGSTADCTSAPNDMPYLPERDSNVTAACGCSSMYKDDAVGRWESFRIRQTDPICQQWLILHKVDNNDQMRCGSFRAAV